jgi:hypothetical protein
MLTIAWTIENGKLVATWRRRPATFSPDCFDAGY